MSPEKTKNKLFDVIDKAPFAGKFTIKDSYVDFETASDEAKTKKMLGTMALLGVMVAAHATQAKMGGESFLTHINEFTQNGDVIDGVLAGADVMYGGVMAAVAARQTALAGKVARKYHTWREQKDVIPEAERRTERRPMARRVGAVAIAVSATMAGQAVGGLSWWHAHETEQAHKQARYEEVIKEGEAFEALYNIETGITPAEAYDSDDTIGTPASVIDSPAAVSLDDASDELLTIPTDSPKP